MDKDERKRRLSEELDRWCAKPYDALARELEDVVNYERDEGRSRYQIEVQLLERTPEYVHVCVALDDGGWRSLVPLTTSFLVYRDGRIERPEIK